MTTSCAKAGLGIQPEKADDDTRQEDMFPVMLKHERKMRLDYAEPQAQCAVPPEAPGLPLDVEVGPTAA